MSRTPAFRILRDAAIIFIAAVCLGFAYNAASPLGVRMHGASGDAPAVAADPVMPSGAPDPALHNETLAAYILEDDPAAVSPWRGRNFP